MRSYTNERRARSRKLRHVISITLNLALLLVVLFGLILLIAFLISPEAANSPILIIAIGLLSTFIGIQAGNQISNLPKTHEVLDDGLKGISSESAIYHYYLPADHVLIAPEGVFTLTARRQRTHITFEDDHHAVHDSFVQRVIRFLTQQSLGQPITDALADAEKIRLWFEDNLSGETAQPQPVLVFVNPESEFEIQGSPSIPVLRADKGKHSLKAYVKNYEGDTGTIQPADADAINAVLRISE